MEQMKNQNIRSLWDEIWKNKKKNLTGNEIPNFICPSITHIIPCRVLTNIVPENEIMFSTITFMVRALSFCFSSSSHKQILLVSMIYTISPTRHKKNIGLEVGQYTPEKNAFCPSIWLSQLSFLGLLVLWYYCKQVVQNIEKEVIPTADTWWECLHQRSGNFSCWKSQNKKKVSHSTQTSTEDSCFRGITTVSDHFVCRIAAIFWGESDRRVDEVITFTKENIYRTTPRQLFDANFLLSTLNCCKRTSNCSRIRVRP